MCLILQLTLIPLAGSSSLTGLEPQSANELKPTSNPLKTMTIFECEDNELLKGAFRLILTTILGDILLLVVPHPERLTTTTKMTMKKAHLNDIDGPLVCWNIWIRMVV